MLVLRAIIDVSVRRFGVIGGKKLFLHHVLNFLRRGRTRQLFERREHLFGQFVQIGVAHTLCGDPGIGLKNGAFDFPRIERHLVPAALDNISNHTFNFPFRFSPAAKPKSLRFALSVLSIIGAFPIHVKGIFSVKTTIYSIRFT